MSFKHVTINFSEKNFGSGTEEETPDSSGVEDGNRKERGWKTEKKVLHQEKFLVGLSKLQRKLQIKAWDESNLI